MGTSVRPHRDDKGHKGHGHGYGHAGQSFEGKYRNSLGRHCAIRMQNKEANQVARVHRCPHFLHRAWCFSETSFFCLSRCASVSTEAPPSGAPPPPPPAAPPPPPMPAPKGGGSGGMWAGHLPRQLPRARHGTAVSLRRRGLQRAWPG